MNPTFGGICFLQSHILFYKIFKFFLINKNTTSLPHDFIVWQIISNLIFYEVTYYYKYNGKELQNETGMYDYGARFYMMDIGRWNGIDQFAEMYASTSTYAYVANNPVLRFDVDGRWFNEDGTIDKSGYTPYFTNGKQYLNSFLGSNRNDESGGGGSNWGQSFTSNSEPTIGNLIDAWLNNISTDEILSIISSNVNNLLDSSDSKNLFDGIDLTQFINKDIIILNASEVAGGKGHSGLIIGNDKDNKYIYIASDGRVDSSGSTWMGGKNDASVKVFKTRKEAFDFAKTRYNYDDSITIKTTFKQDLDATVRAMQQLQSNYHFIFNNCNHIISAALVGAGLSKYGGYSVIPNVRGCLNLIFIFNIKKLRSSP